MFVCEGGANKKSNNDSESLKANVDVCDKVVSERTIEKRALIARTWVVASDLAVEISDSCIWRNVINKQQPDQYVRISSLKVASFVLNGEREDDCESDGDTSDRPRGRGNQYKSNSYQRKLPVFTLLKHLAQSGR